MKPNQRPWRGILTALGLAVAMALTAPATAQAAGADDGTPRPQGVTADGQAKQPNSMAAAAADDPGPWITRNEILSRAKSWYDAKVPYSMEAYRGGYRTDCSGYVSMAWHTNRNYWTGDLNTIGVQITYNELRPGDMLLYHNTANPVNGSHVVLFERWVGAVGGDFMMYEQTNPSTKHRLWSQTNYSRSLYKPFKYRRVLEAGTSGADVAWLQGSGVFTFSGAGFPTIGSVNGIGTPTWAGVGDYTHDGKDDLFWYYAGDGTIHTCDANGTTFTNCTMRRGPGVGQPDWAGVGDFDGDGYRDDIAWHQGSAIFTFSGTGLSTIGAVDGIAAPAWAGVGDYNHDGKDDLFWFYADGTLHTCQSNGTTFVDCGLRRPPGIGTPDWAGVGDFDGDGYRDDIAWHQGSAIFTFSGTGLSTIGAVDGIAAPTWAGVGDYNHDGKDDLIWYYGDDGTLHTCQSNATTFVDCGLRRGPGVGTPTWAATGTFH